MGVAGTRGDKCSGCYGTEWQIVSVDHAKIPDVSGPRVSSNSKKGTVNFSAANVLQARGDRAADQESINVNYLAVVGCNDG